MRVSLKYFCLKAAPIPILFAAFSWPIATILTIVGILIYRRIIAMIFGLDVLPATDISTFLGKTNQNVNIMSATIMEKVQG